MSCLAVIKKSGCGEKRSPKYLTPTQTPRNQGVGLTGHGQGGGRIGPEQISNPGIRGTGESLCESSPKIPVQTHISGHQWLAIANQKRALTAPSKIDLSFSIFLLTSP